MSETTTLTSKGQLVIPKAVRERLHLQPGDILQVSVSGRRIVLDSGPAKTRKLGDWLLALQLSRPDLDVDALSAPVDQYRD